MSQENAEKFVEKLRSDESFRQKVKQAGESAFKDQAKAAGYGDVTIDEVHAALRSSAGAAGGQTRLQAADAVVIVSVAVV
ncbi:MAG: Nif11-like leader peptide family natural product precursor [Candidatus Eremiobacteraeota bacterium]|nr:Nif11-like leader peptide family natural product precursor [Candidatus Eremiobacteraeota bacterium]